MATQAAETVSIRSGAGTFAALADRWIYVFMAALLFATVLTGFIPASMGKLEAVTAGVRPPFPGFMHFHAVMMGAWISLLLVQSTLMATGKRGWHMRLGIVSVVLVPAVVVSMVGIVAATFVQLATLPPGAMPPDDLAVGKFFASNLILEQTRVVILFPALIIWALLVRREDPETHKRLIFVATLPPLSAAIDRIEWLPTSLPASPASIFVTQLLWLAPLLIYDLWRRGRLHKAYVIGIALNLPFIIFSYLNWGTDWWMATAPKLFGIQSW
jgi:hypothetical protein